MTRTQGERIVAIETKIDSLTEKVEQLIHYNEKQDATLKELKNEFAAKWAEKAVYAIVMAIVAIALKIIFS